MKSKEEPFIVSDDGKVLLSVDDDVDDLHISEGIEVIGEHAFSFCPGLAKVSIPETVLRIERFAFSDSNLENIFLPKSVESIGEECFSSCARLKSIDVDSENTVYSSIDGVLFDNEKNTLIAYPMSKDGKCFVIPNGVTSIGTCAFAGSSLESIKIPFTLKEIGQSAFAFCKNLREVSIPNGVVEIGDMTFFDCQSLTEVRLSNNLSSIGGYAFSGCQSLQHVRMPFSVTKIDEKAFEDCRHLSAIFCEMSNPSIMYVSDLAFDESLFGQCTLYVPASSIKSYFEHPVFGQFACIQGLSAANG